MGRRTIEVGEGHTNPFEERPETDAEWHARLLEDITASQEQTNAYLGEIIQHHNC